MFRAVLALLGCMLVVGGLCPATAGAAPPVPAPAPEETLTGICSFDVQLTVVRQNEFIIHETAAPDARSTTSTPATWSLGSPTGKPASR